MVHIVRIAVKQVVAGDRLSGGGGGGGGGGFIPEYKLIVNSYMKFCFVFLSINHGASGNIYTTFFIYMYMIGIFFFPKLLQKSFVGRGHIWIYGILQERVKHLLAEFIILCSHDNCEGAFCFTSVICPFIPLVHSNSSNLLQFFSNQSKTLLKRKSY